MQDLKPRLYSCFDFALRSEIALDELDAVAAGSERAIVDIRYEALPEILEGAAPASLGLQVAGDVALLTVERVARYRVTEGREITVDAMAGASARNIRLFLLGSALGLLCYQRELLLLHANAIVAGDVAVAFAGESGAGKSTLAAHFQRAGYAVLCDDVCAIRFDANGAPVALPGLPRLKLWGEAARNVGLDPAALDVAIEGHDKYHVPLTRAQTTGSAPFMRLYLLARAEDGEPAAIERLHGMRAMAAIMENSYRGGYLGPMGLAQRHFGQCAALAAQIEVYRASRRWGYAVFKEQAALLERHFEGA